MEPVDEQQPLFNREQFAHTCTKCGHGVELHRSGYGCRGMVGALECKCYRFGNNPPVQMTGEPEQ